MLFCIFQLFRFFPCCSAYFRCALRISVLLRLRISICHRLFPCCFAYFCVSHISVLFCLFTCFAWFHVVCVASRQKCCFANFRVVQLFQCCAYFRVALLRLHISYEWGILLQESSPPPPHVLYGSSLPMPFQRGEIISGIV